MPRIRSIKPDLWQSEEIAAVSERARLVFIGLITQADDEGRLKGSPQLIASQIYPYDEDVGAPEISGALAELSGVDLVQQYRVAGKPFIQLPSWHHHQRISHPTESALPSPSRADSADAPEDSTPVPEDSADAPEGSRATVSGRDRKGGDRSGGEGRSSATAADAPLSHLLADLVAGNDPNGKRPTVTKRWANAERLMLESDGRSYEEAERLIRWTQQNGFWRGNVLSMPKFREKYTQLYNAAVDDAQKRKGKQSGKPAPGIARAREIAQQVNGGGSEEAA